MVGYAVIMAGGEGVRLRPLTEERPKPLMPLLDEPVIGYTLRLLHRHQVKRATLTLCYRAEQIRDAVGDGSRWGMQVDCREEAVPRGTAGSVRDAAGDARETLLVMSGDGLTDCDLTWLWQQHVRSGAEATLVLRQAEGGGAYGVCVTDETGRICRFVEKPEGGARRGDLINTGIYFLEPSVLKRIPADKPYDFGRELFPQMVTEGAKIFGAEMHGYWCDIGNPAAYARAQRDLLMGRVGLPVSGRRMGRAILAEGCHVDARARVTGRCYVGPEARVEAMAVLGPGTVVGCGARVGAHARLENACLWENVEVGRDAILRDMVVMRSRRGGGQRAVPCGAPTSGESARNGS